MNGMRDANLKSIAVSIAIGSLLGQMSFGSVSTDPADYQLEGDKVVVVQDGDVLFMTGRLSGSGKLVKSGAGELWLSGGNVHSGGVSVEAGDLVAASASALGTGAASIVGGTGTLAFGADSASFSNAISVTGDSTDACPALRFESATTLTGTVSGNGAIYIATGWNDTATAADSENVKFTGSVVADVIALSPHTTVGFGYVESGKMRLYATENAFAANGLNPGAVKLNDGTSRIQEIEIDSTRIVCGADRVFTKGGVAAAGNADDYTKIVWTGENKVGGSIDLNDHSQTLGYVTTPVTTADDLTSMRIFNSGSILTEVEFFQDKNRKAAQNIYIKFDGAIALVNHFHCLTLANRRHTIESLSASRHIYFTGQTRFERKFSVTVSGGSTFYADDAEDSDIFAAADFTFGNNTFKFNAKSFGSLPNDSTYDLKISDPGAIISIPEDSLWNVRSCYLTFASAAAAAGHSEILGTKISEKRYWLKPGSYTKDDLGVSGDTGTKSRFPNGTLNVLLDGGVATGSNAAFWADGKWVDAGDAEIKPDFSVPDYSVLYAKSGMSASIPGVMRVGGLTLSAPASGAFELAKQGADSSVVAYGPWAFTQKSEGWGGCVYDFKVPVTLASAKEQSIVLNATDVVKMSGGLKGVDDLTVDLGGSYDNYSTASGSAGNYPVTGGTLEVIGDDNPFAGDVNVKCGGNMLVTGTFGSALGAGTFSFAGSMTTKNVGTKYGSIVFSNTTVNTRFVGSAIGTSAANAHSWLRLNGRNVFNREFDMGPSGTVRLGPGSEVEFKDGFKGVANARLTADDSDLPVKISFAGRPFCGSKPGDAQASKNFLLINGNAPICAKFDVAGSYAALYFQVGNGAEDKPHIVEFGTSAALSAPYWKMGRYTELRLNGTKQEVPYFMKGDTSLAKSTPWYVTGDEGAVLAVTDGGAADGNESDKYCCGTFTNKVGLLKRGSGHLLMVGAQSTTTGPLTVREGIVEFASNASWVGGGPINVQGGKLKVNVKDTFARESTISFSGDGCLEIASGRIRVDHCLVDGVAVPDGRYSASSGGPLAGRVLGGGSLTVGNPGLVIVVQ